MHGCREGERWVGDRDAGDRNLDRGTESWNEGGLQVEYKIDHDLAAQIEANQTITVLKEEEPHRCLCV